MFFNLMQMEEAQMDNGIKMPANMMIGPPTLRVRNLQQQLSFYEKKLGLQMNRTYQEDNLDVVDLGFKGKFKDYLWNRP